MIAPLVDEDIWIETLQNAPRWYPPHKRTVIVAPHPDDETLGAGGLIAEQSRRGLPVSVVCVTDGEAAYPDAPGLAQLRTNEQQQALETLRVSTHNIFRLNLPDSALAEHESKLTALLTPFLPSDTLVLAPWIKDWHPDHEACGRVVRRIARATGAELLFYMFWTWHQGTPDVLSDVPVRCFELDRQLLSLKQTALECHRSQLQRETGPPILPESLLKPARRSFETFILNA